MDIARSAILSRVSSTTTLRAKVVYVWQKFARSDEQILKVVTIQRRFRARAAQRKAKEEIARSSVRAQKITQQQYAELKNVERQTKTPKH